MRRKKFLILAGTVLITCLLLTGCDLWDSLRYIFDGNEETTSAAAGFDIYAIDIPDYSGKAWVEINGNEPFFTDSEITNEFFIDISDLDGRGRCQGNIMCADEEHMQDGERQSLSGITPTGWHSGSIYQRSHLLMWKLGGPDDERNIITGTETFNQETMLEFEERVTAYIWRHPGIHVMYRVTPYFKGRDKVARGVLMEAYSVEDSGGLTFCIFAYNVEPGCAIDYADGTYTPE